MEYEYDNYDGQGDGGGDGYFLEDELATMEVQDVTFQLYESLVEFQEPEEDGGDAEGASDPQKTSSKKASLRSVLDAILPPKVTVTPDGSAWKQRVSLRRPERDDVIALQLKLDERLQARQARENGLCPVREQLYSQCLDELIRQVAIERPERGLLLMRVRDEVRMTIAAYQTLYQSSITFGMRKALQAEQGMAEMLKRVQELDERKKQLQAELREAKSHCETVEKRTTERRAANDKKMMEEKDFLKFQAANLENFLKTAHQ